jgi:hypothetical protein
MYASMQPQVLIDPDDPSLFAITFDRERPLYFETPQRTRVLGDMQVRRSGAGLLFHVLRIGLSAFLRAPPFYMP